MIDILHCVGLGVTSHVLGNLALEHVFHGSLPSVENQHLHVESLLSSAKGTCCRVLLPLECNSPLGVSCLILICPLS